MWYQTDTHRGTSAEVATGPQSPRGSMVSRRIAGFHQDEERHWVAELECGHNQHVRHDPPWTTRHWVTTPEGRRQHLGKRS